MKQNWKFSMKISLSEKKEKKKGGWGGGNILPINTDVEMSSQICFQNIWKEN